MSVYLVTVRETFQTQVRVDADSQAEAKRNVREGLRLYPPDPPNYAGDPDELPRSIRRAVIAAWSED